MNRRRFIGSSSLAAASLWVPKFVFSSTKSLSSYNGKSVVVIQLSGGNDGLNSIVPHKDDWYFKLRPQLSLAEEDLIATRSGFAFNKALEGLYDLNENGELCILNRVGYPNPDRSHFRSMDIWHTASESNEYLSTGWVGRTLDATCDNINCRPYKAVEIDDSLSLSMKGDSVKGLAFRDVRSLKNLSGTKIVQQTISTKPIDDDHDDVGYLHKVLAGTVESADYIASHHNPAKLAAVYPLHEFAQRMRTVASLIIGGSETMVYYVSLSGFDTHALQKGTQSRLLKVYADTVRAFCSDLKRNNRFNDTLVMTFSEFGRRVAENAGRGTDHGKANNLFLCSGSLKKQGLYNAMPDLSKLDDGDIPYDIDFRNVYATVLNRWLNVDSVKVLGRDFAPLNFI